MREKSALWRKKATTTQSLQSEWSDGTLKMSIGLAADPICIRLVQLTMQLGRFTDSALYVCHPRCVCN